MNKLIFLGTVSEPIERDDKNGRQRLDIEETLKFIQFYPSSKRLHLNI